VRGGFLRLVAGGGWCKLASLPLSCTGGAGYDERRYRPEKWLKNQYIQHTINKLVEKTEAL
jgi:hypothetical protein